MTNNHYFILNKIYIFLFLQYCFQYQLFLHSQIYNKMANIKCETLLLNPSQLFYWNLFILILNMVLVIYLPYKYFFFFSLPSVTHLEIIIVSIVLLIQTIEIFIKLRTRPDMLGTDYESRLFVTRNYLGVWLILDILGGIAIVSLLIPETDWPIARLLIYCKLPSIIKYDRHISITIKSQIFDFCYILIKVLFLYLVYCNFTAGAFFKIDYAYYLQQGEYFYDNMLWLVDSNSMKDIIDWSVPVHYVYSIFWSVITASCTGYGDITPLNPMEVLFTIFVIAPNVLLFGFLIDNINFKFDQLKQKSTQIKQSEQAILRLLRDSKVDKQLFYEFKYHISKLVAQQIDESRTITRFLTKKLSNQLTQQIFKQPWSKLENITVTDTLELLPYFHEITSFQKQIVYPGTKYYFVIEGQGKIVLSGLDYCCYENGAAEIAKYHQRNTLNIHSFFSRQPNAFIKYESTHYSRFYIIEKLPDILSFKKKSNQVLINKKYSKYGIDCQICKSGSHISEQCFYFCFLASVKQTQREVDKSYCFQYNTRQHLKREQRSNQIECRLKAWIFQRFQQKYYTQQNSFDI